MAAKKAAKKAVKTAKKKAPVAGVGVDTSRALTRKLTPEQMHALLKIGDVDRAIASRVGKVLKNYEATLAIPGVTSDGILADVRASEAIVHDEGTLASLVERFMGARLLSDDRIWKAIVKLHRRIQSECKDDPAIMADFDFLLKHFATRSKRTRATAVPAATGTPPTGGTSGGK